MILFLIILPWSINDLMLQMMKYNYQKIDMKNINTKNKY